MPQPAPSEASVESSHSPVCVPRGHYLIVYCGRITPGASIDGVDDLLDVLHTYSLWFGAVRRLESRDYPGQPPGFVVERLPEPSDPGYRRICETLQKNFDVYIPVMPGTPRPPFAVAMEQD